MISTSHPWISLKFDDEGVSITQRKFFDTFKNCYSFWALYANIDDVCEAAAKAKLSISDYLHQNAGEQKLIDRWILSRYNSVVAKVMAALDNYNVTGATRLIQNFVIDDLSNWYIRLNRSRFYGSGDDPDKMLVYSRLYDVLWGLCGIVAPIAPFFADFVYRQLLGANAASQPESVHLTAFPASDSTIIDETLEEDMAYVQKIVSLALAARKRKNLKVRQPLPRIAISSGRKALESDGMSDIICRELNIKAVEFIDDPGDLIRYSARPNFSRLGPKYGKDLGKLTKLVQGMTTNEIKKFMADGKVTVQLNGERLTLVEDDVEIAQVEAEGYAVESDGDVTVALSTELTAELVEEGFARELVNKIQNMRKTSDFNVTDRIEVTLHAEEPLVGAAQRFDEYIRSETLARTLNRQSLSEADDTAKEWNINGEKAKISIRRV
jgi:isoleucyl-tRNA synthetase